MTKKNTDKSQPDRPLECAACKKPIAVCYTEIVQGNILHTSMCADCPELQRRLYGTAPKEHVANQMDTAADLECGTCGTTLEEVRRGHSLGCAECYAVFGDVIMLDLQSTEKALAKKKALLQHIGRAPGEQLVISPSSQLVALNEALKETLSREDYEQAAALRDQIKVLESQKSKESEKKGSGNGRKTRK